MRTKRSLENLKTINSKKSKNYTDLIRTTLLLILLSLPARSVSEYSFNPLKYYDDKLGVFFLIQAKPHSVGSNLFFARGRNSLLNFLEQEAIFEVPQPPLEPSFEPYYSNYMSLLSLNSVSSKGQEHSEEIRGHPQKKAFLKKNGMDFESLRFRNKKNKREYDLQEVLESKRMDPLYNFVNRFESENFHLILERENLKFAEVSGLKEALGSVTNQSFMSLTQWEANPIKIVSKEVSANDGLYKEKKLKFYFRIQKGITQVELLDIRTDNPQVSGLICNHRLFERITLYKECRHKVKVLNRFYFHLKMKFPAKLDKGGTWCIRILKNKYEQRIAEVIPEEWLNLRRLKRKFCKEEIITYTDINKSNTFELRVVPRELKLKFNTYFFLIIDKKQPVVVSISEKIQLKDTKLHFELLFLNKTSTITPNAPFDNYLFIRNLKPEKLTPNSNEKKCKLKCSSQSENHKKCKEEFAKCQGKIEEGSFRLDSLQFEQSEGLLREPGNFHDSSLQSQKIPKEFRKKMFQDLITGSVTCLECYKLKLTKEYEGQKDYWDFNPNEIRPILEVTNKKSNPGVCESQEKQFPLHNVKSDLCSNLGEDATLCRQRESLERDDYISECNYYKLKFRTRQIDYKNKTLDLNHPLLKVIMESVESIRSFCSHNSRKGTDLYDTISEEYKSYYKCGKEYSKSKADDEEQSFNLTTKECLRANEHIYDNFFGYCKKIELYFDILQEPLKEECKEKYQTIILRKHYNRTRFSQNIFINYLELVTTGYRHVYKNKMDFVRKDLLRKMNILETLSYKLFIMNYDKEFGEKETKQRISFDNLMVTASTLVYTAEESKNYYMFHNRLKRMNGTFAVFCPLVKATRSADYLDYLPKLKMKGLTFKQIASLYMYIYNGIVKSSNTTDYLSETRHSGFDIFRNKNLEYLSESSLFRILSRLLRDLKMSFQKFFSGLVKKSNNLLNEETYNTVFFYLGRDHRILSEAFLAEVDYCNNYSHDQSKNLLNWLFFKDSLCFHCNSLYVYKVTTKISLSQSKRFRILFLRVLALTVSKEDLISCMTFLRRKEEPIASIKELKLKVNNKQFYFSFPLTFTRDRVIFEHSSIDLGMSSQKGTFHIANIYISNRARVPLIIRRLTLYFDNSNFEVKIAMFYREHLLLPFQKERLLLAKIIASFNTKINNVSSSQLRGYLQAEFLAEGQPGLFNERIHFRMKYSKDFMKFTPGNRLSLESDGKDIEMINSSLDDYKRFVIHIKNSSPSALFIENFQLVEKKSLMDLYEFAALNSKILNDSHSSLVKRNQGYNSECSTQNCHDKSHQKEKLKVKNKNFKHLSNFNPNKVMGFDQKLFKLDSQKDQFLATIDHVKGRGLQFYRRPLIFSFLTLSGYLSTKLEFINQKLDCTIFKKLTNYKPTAITSNCFKGLTLLFGYYSKHLMITNFGLEELVVSKVELSGLELWTELQLEISIRSLKEPKSLPLLHSVTLSGNSKKELNLLLFSQDRCQIKIVWVKQIKKILSKFQKRVERCNSFRLKLDDLLLSKKKQTNKDGQDKYKMSDEELEKLLKSQMEDVERRYELEEKIRKCSKRSTVKRFSHLKKPKLIFYLSNGKQFEVFLQSRNLKGKFKVFPEEPVVNVLFPGPSKYFKFEAINTFGKPIKILDIVNKPLKLKLFEAYYTKNLIKPSNKPVEFIEAYVKPRIVTLGTSWRHQPMTGSEGKNFSFHDMESYFENSKIIEYLKRENMMSFKAQFDIYTNIIPVISVKVTVHINEPLFFQDRNTVDLGNNSLEFQNFFHLTLNNPFNEPMHLRLFLVPKGFLTMVVNDSPAQAKVDNSSKKMMVMKNPKNYVCLNNKFLSKRNLKFFAKFYFGVNIIFLANNQNLFGGMNLSCDPLFSFETNSNSINNSLKNNEETCFFLSENNSVQNVIYMKLKNTPNNFFEISKKQRISNSKQNSSVLLLRDIERYSELFVSTEIPISMARDLPQKIKKKSDNLLNWIEKVSSKVQEYFKGSFNVLRNLFFWVKRLLTQKKSHSSKNTGKTKKTVNRGNHSSVNSRELGHQKINHIKDFKESFSKKFMFLNKNIVNKRLIVPPFSSLNVPRMMLVDFKSKRKQHNKKEDYLEFKFPESVEKELGIALSSTKYKLEDLDHQRIEDSLDEMVLVMKNNLTVVSLIPVKYSISPKFLRVEKSTSFEFNEETNVILLPLSIEDLQMSSVEEQPQLLREVILWNFQTQKERITEWSTKLLGVVNKIKRLTKIFSGCSVKAKNKQSQIISRLKTLRLIKKWVCRLVNFFQENPFFSIPEEANPETPKNFWPLTKVEIIQRIIHSGESNNQKTKQHKLGSTINSDEHEIIIKEGVIMSKEIAKRIELKHSEEFPITSKNLRLVSNYSNSLRIKGFKTEGGNLIIDLGIEVNKSLAQTIQAELEISSDKLFYLFMLRISPQGFKLVSVRQDFWLRTILESFIYFSGFLGILILGFKLVRTVWQLKSEIGLILKYIQNDSQELKINQMVQTGKGSILKLFNGFTKKVLRILERVSTFDKVIQLFIRVKKGSKKFKEKRKLKISRIENRLSRERTKHNNLASNLFSPTWERHLNLQEVNHEHVISKQGVIKQLLIEERLDNLKDKTARRIKDSSDEMWWLLKHIYRKKEVYSGDLEDQLDQNVSKLEALSGSKIFRKGSSWNKKKKKSGDSFGLWGLQSILKKGKKIKHRKVGSKDFKKDKRKRVMIKGMVMDCESPFQFLKDNLQSDRKIILKGNPFFEDYSHIAKNSMLVNENEHEQSNSDIMDLTIKEKLRMEQNVYCELLEQHSKKQIHKAKDLYNKPNLDEIYFPTFCFTMSEKNLFQETFNRLLARFPDLESINSNKDKQDSEYSQKSNSSVRSKKIQDDSDNEQGHSWISYALQNDKLNATISRVNETQSFSIEKNLVEMMDKRPIKTRFSMEEILPEVNNEKYYPRKRKLSKTKSQNFQLSDGKEITNEEYFDLLDNEKGNQKTKLNDIFKNFRTKKIQEKEEFIDFPFRISEEEDSQDESSHVRSTQTGNLSGRPTNKIMKTESYHVISSTSSFRSGKNSKFYKKRDLDSKNKMKIEKVVPVLSGNNLNGSVFSGSTSKVSKGKHSTKRGLRKEKLTKKERLNKTKTTGSKRSRRNKKKRKTGYNLGVVNTDNSQSGSVSRQFNVVDDQLLREKKSETENSKQTLKRENFQTEEVDSSDQTYQSVEKNYWDYSLSQGISGQLEQPSWNFRESTDFHQMRMRKALREQEIEKSLKQLERPMMPSGLHMNPQADWLWPVENPSIELDRKKRQPKDFKEAMKRKVILENEKKKSVKRNKKLMERYKEKQRDSGTSDDKIDPRMVNLYMNSMLSREMRNPNYNQMGMPGFEGYGYPPYKFAGYGMDPMSQSMGYPRQSYPYQMQKGLSNAKMQSQMYKYLMAQKQVHGLNRVIDEEREWRKNKDRSTNTREKMKRKLLLKKKREESVEKKEKIVGFDSSGEEDNTPSYNESISSKEKQTKHMKVGYDTPKTSRKWLQSGLSSDKKEGLERRELWGWEDNEHLIRKYFGKISESEDVIRADSESEEKKHKFKPFKIKGSSRNNLQTQHKYSEEASDLKGHLSGLVSENFESSRKNTSQNKLPNEMNLKLSNQYKKELTKEGDSNMLDPSNTEENYSLKKQTSDSKQIGEDPLISNKRSPPFLQRGNKCFLEDLKTPVPKVGSKEIIYEEGSGRKNPKIHSKEKREGEDFDNSKSTYLQTKKKSSKNKTQNEKNKFRWRKF